MAPRISLALAIHNHQPVGNFGWVLAENHDTAYRPMLDALDRHPGVRLSLHYTGPLLEWLRRERPGFLVQLRALVDRGQVELLGGGHYEPVLASLPERDRIGQLLRMATELEALTGRRPRGAWLAERVWEPDLPTSLVEAGYSWTILDDAHFRAAAIPEDNLWGAWTTEDQGRLLTVFGTEQGLRYRIPFGEVDDVIDYLRDHATEAGDRVGTMGDDGEKFGAWPTTFEHCWGKGRWVDRFFKALEANRSWLTTVTPSAWLDREPPIGRVYVPTSSYAEMGEWALPAEESLAFSHALHRASESHRPEARWLRGGFWRNFQVKYREINDLHKQMLRTSAKVMEMPEGDAKARALDHLYRGQSNDCYWHGLFGGIYLSHLRASTYAHLIAAEDLADATAGTLSVGALGDLDLDGIDEALLAGPGQVVTVKLSEGAGIGSWDIRAARHALGAVMRRRPEAYHERLRTLAGEDAEGPAGAEGDGPADAGPAGAETYGPANAAATPASIHDIVAVKESGLAERLQYDGHERRSGLVHLYATGTTAEAVARAEAVELGDFVDQPFEVLELTVERLVASREGSIAASGGTRLPLRVEKALGLGGDRLAPELRLDVVVENRSQADIDAVLAVEWDVTLLGGGGNPAAWWDVDGRRTAHDVAGSAEAPDELRSGNDQLGIALVTTAEPPPTAWWAPIETISNSEAGFERVYQGSSLVLSWPTRIGPGERRAVRIAHTVAVARDLAAEEAAADAS